MADTYGVTDEDVAAEMPALFKGGFTAGTTPTIDGVRGFISDADTVATLTVERLGLADPAGDAMTARIARRYIINRVKAEIVRIVYMANDPRDVAQAAAPFDADAATMLTQLEAMVVPPVTVATPSFRPTTSSSVNQVVF